MGKELFDLFDGEAGSPISQEECLSMALDALKCSDVVDALGQQFVLSDLSGDKALDLSKIVMSALAVAYISFRVFPDKDFDGLLLSHIKAAFMLGKLVGTLPTAVADDENK